MLLRVVCLCGSLLSIANGYRLVPLEKKTFINNDEKHELTRYAVVPVTDYHNVLFNAKNDLAIHDQESLLNNNMHSVINSNENLNNNYEGYHQHSEAHEDAHDIHKNIQSQKSNTKTSYELNLNDRTDPETIVITYDNVITKPKVKHFKTVEKVSYQLGENSKVNNEIYHNVNSYNSPYTVSGVRNEYKLHNVPHISSQVENVYEIVNSKYAEFLKLHPNLSEADKQRYLMLINRLASISNTRKQTDENIGPDPGSPEHQYMVKTLHNFESVMGPDPGGSEHSRMQKKLQKNGTKLNSRILPDPSLFVDLTSRRETPKNFVETPYYILQSRYEDLDTNHPDYQNMIKNWNLNDGIVPDPDTTEYYDMVKGLESHDKQDSYQVLESRYGDLDTNHPDYQTKIKKFNLNDGMRPDKSQKHGDMMEGLKNHGRQSFYPTLQSRYEDLDTNNPQYQNLVTQLNLNDGMEPYPGSHELSNKMQGPNHGSREASDFSFPELNSEEHHLKIYPVINPNTIKTLPHNDAYKVDSQETFYFPNPEISSGLEFIESKPDIKHQGFSAVNKIGNDNVGYTVSSQETYYLSNSPQLNTLDIVQNPSIHSSKTIFYPERRESPNNVFEVFASPPPNLRTRDGENGPDKNSEEYKNIIEKLAANKRGSDPGSPEYNKMDERLTDKMGRVGMGPDPLGGKPQYNDGMGPDGGVDGNPNGTIPIFNDAQYDDNPIVKVPIDDGMGPDNGVDGNPNGTIPIFNDAQYDDNPIVKVPIDDGMGPDNGVDGNPNGTIPIFNDAQYDDNPIVKVPIDDGMGPDNGVDGNPNGTIPIFNDAQYDDNPIVKVPTDDPMGRHGGSDGTSDNAEIPQFDDAQYDDDGVVPVNPLSDQLPADYSVINDLPHPEEQLPLEDQQAPDYSVIDDLHPPEEQSPPEYEPSAEEQPPGEQTPSDYSGQEDKQPEQVPADYGDQDDQPEQPPPDDGGLRDDYSPPTYFEHAPESPPSDYEVLDDYSPPKYYELDASPPDAGPTEDYSPPPYYEPSSESASVPDFDPSSYAPDVSPLDFGPATYDGDSRRDNIMRYSYIYPRNEKKLTFTPFRVDSSRNDNNIWRDGIIAYKDMPYIYTYKDDNNGYGSHANVWTLPNNQLTTNYWSGPVYSNTYPNKLNRYTNYLFNSYTNQFNHQHVPNNIYSRTKGYYNPYSGNTINHGQYIDNTVHLPYNGNTADQKPDASTEVEEEPLMKNFSDGIYSNVYGNRNINWNGINSYQDLGYSATGYYGPNVLPKHSQASYYTPKQLLSVPITTAEDPENYEFEEILRNKNLIPTNPFISGQFYHTHEKSEFDPNLILHIRTILKNVNLNWSNSHETIMSIIRYLKESGLIPQYLTASELGKLYNTIDKEMHKVKSRKSNIEASNAVNHLHKHYHYSPDANKLSNVMSKFLKLLLISTL